MKVENIGGRVTIPSTFYSKKVFNQYLFSKAVGQTNQTRFILCLC